MSFYQILKKNKKNSYKTINGWMKLNLLSNKSYKTIIKKLLKLFQFWIRKLKED